MYRTFLYVGAFLMAPIDVCTCGCVHAGAGVGYIIIYHFAIT